MSRYWNFLFLLILIIEKSYAIDQEPLYKSYRAQAMGGAFTAVADDQDSIFYNPAGLGGVKKIALNIASIQLEASKDLISTGQKLAKTHSKLDGNSAQSLIGKNFYLRGQYSSSIIFPYFGFAILADEQAVANIKNLSMLQGVIGSQTTYGMQAAIGFPVVKFKRKKGTVRLGFAPKLLWRTGGFKQFDLTDVLTLNTGPYKNLTNQFGVGYGIDFGAQFVKSFKKKFSFTSAIAWKDIGNTSFELGADPQIANLIFGVAGVYKSKDAVMTLSYDYSNILDKLDWKKKNHIGFELKFSLFKLYAGLNQFTITYGGGLDLGLLDLMFVSYSQERGVYVGQDSEQRYMGKVALKFEM